MDMAVSLIGKMAVILAPQKKEKPKRQMLKEKDSLSGESKNSLDILYYKRL